MKVLFVIAHMGLGGAQRQMSVMMRYWAAKGWDLTLVTLDHGASFYEIPDSVKVVGLGVAGASGGGPKAIFNNMIRSRRLRRVFKQERPDVVISFLNRTNVLTLVAARRLGLKVVVSERSNPFVESIGRAWAYLRERTYGGAHRVVLQTTGVCAYFPHLHNLAVIANPIVDSGVRRTPHPGLKRVVAMGRLSPEKGFDRLIEAFLGADVDGWELVIFGEGPAREELERQTLDAGANARVRLPGSTQSAYQELAASDLYVLSSRHEGFPNALAEAMSVGLPAVAFDLNFGPRDIIRQGVDGLLVQDGDVARLASAMRLLMLDDAKREVMGHNAVDVLERFSLESMMRLWEREIGA